MTKALGAAILLALLAGCGGGGGNTAASTPSSSSGNGTVLSGGDIAYSDQTVYAANPGSSLATSVEGAAVTHHQLQLGSNTLNYTATAGHLTATNPVSGQAEASFFYVAYTLDNQPAASRPLTILYNGGPGSASVWLHLGSFGPNRVVTNDPSTNVPSPVQLVSNAESMLDVSDLVFVDAVGTGYSEAIAPNTNQSFWSVDQDALVFRDFVTRYQNANQRTTSPLFLFGESYGTTRSPLLATALLTAGVPVSGIVLQSSILNYNSNCSMFAAGQVSCAGFLPSYGAVGAWYSLVSPAPTDLPSFMISMRSLTASSYIPALNQYLASATIPSSSLLGQLSSNTGISASIWQQNVDLGPDLYRTSLLPGQLIGRYDARVVVPSNSSLASGGDPSSSVITPPFTSAMQSYLPNVLKYTNASIYTISGNAINYWDFSHDNNSLPDVVPDLATAFALNPNLRVLSLNGYHDLATPFYQTEQDLARLGAGLSVTSHDYQGGHMIYLDDTSRPLEKADLAAFYAATLAQ